MAHREFIRMGRLVTPGLVACHGPSQLDAGRKVWRLAHCMRLIHPQNQTNSPRQEKCYKNVSTILDPWAILTNARQTPGNCFKMWEKNAYYISFKYVGYANVSRILDPWGILTNARQTPGNCFKLWKKMHMISFFKYVGYSGLTRPAEKRCFHSLRWLFMSDFWVALIHLQPPALKKKKFIYLKKINK